MQRVPEPEIMDDYAQAKAYAEADFSVPHDLFVQTFREKFPAPDINDAILDLGCGPCDITRRFARAYPDAYMHAIDASKAMLKYAEIGNRENDLQQRIKLIEGYVPDVVLPQNFYHYIISNSLLHHLHNPQLLWEFIQRHAKPFAKVFIMDLMRPPDRQTVDYLVSEYAVNEAEVLRKDFENSLYAAFSVAEVQQQLNQVGLGKLNIEEITDRHFIVYGQL